MLKFFCFCSPYFFLPLLCPLLFSNFRFNEILSFSFKKKKKNTSLFDNVVDDIRHLIQGL